MIDEHDLAHFAAYQPEAPRMATKEELEAIWQNGGVIDPAHFLGWLPEREIIVPKVREYEPPTVKRRAGLVAVPRRGPPGSPRRMNSKERKRQAAEQAAAKLEAAMDEAEKETAE